MGELGGQQVDAFSLIQYAAPIAHTNLYTMASAAASRRSTVNGLMRAVNHGVTCPCHGCKAANGITDVVQAGRALLSKGRARSYAVPATETTTDYAFEVSAANLRFGSGVTVSCALALSPRPFVPFPLACFIVPVLRTFLSIFPHSPSTTNARELTTKDTLHSARLAWTSII